MRFSPGGPDIPAVLIAAQERGQVLFVCGAGVSRMAGLPLFRGLVEKVYATLSEDWKHHVAERAVMDEDGRLAGQYDRMLRSLERRLEASSVRRGQGMRARIRNAVRAALVAPVGASLTNHLALLELSRDADGTIRLLTTNFDTLFERAWKARFGKAVDSYAGPAMPQPKTAGCNGVLHLHGRLADDDHDLSETELVLTSAEFGDAYLRSGWATRYIYDMVRAHTLVLIGYQAEDPPMRYLLEALEADRERYHDLNPVYAFAPADDGNDEEEIALWRAKGVEPIIYCAPDNDHSSLYRSITQWRDYAQDPTTWRRSRLEATFRSDPAQLSESGVAACHWLLGHGDAPELLGDLSPSAPWLGYLARRGIIDRGGQVPGKWITKRINDPEMIRQCAALDQLDPRALGCPSGVVKP